LILEIFDEDRKFWYDTELVLWFERRFNKYKWNGLIQRIELNWIIKNKILVKFNIKNMNLIYSYVMNKYEYSTEYHILKSEFPWWNLIILMRLQTIEMNEYIRVLINERGI
jgi:hypothetical protein